MTKIFSFTGLRLLRLTGILGLLSFASINFFLGGLVQAAESNVNVTIADGTLKGVQNNGAMSFKGIPYGADTSGVNRFKAPQPVGKWIGVRDATQYGDLSPQPPHVGMGEGDDTIFDWYAPVKPVHKSESALALNVFTPNLNKNAKRPVLFYIHGGGYFSGTGGTAGTDGTNLAKDGDVVVVTINHRLGALGYTNLLSTNNPAYADAANAGNLDIVAALRWVHNNIKAFGGDANNVTLFGQSGGGSKIMTLLAMPEAKGLFQKVISMSGAAGINVDYAKDMETYDKAFLKELNITEDNLDDLQKFSSDELLAARDRAIRDSGIDGARPVIDGKHIVTKPFSSQGLAMQSNIPMMLGYTRTEAALFFRADPRNFTITEAQMRERMKKSFNIDDAKVSRIIEAYHQGNPNMTPYDIYVAVASDVQFRLPLENAARIKSSTSGQAPVYMYQFAWPIPAMNGVLGSPHAVDIPFAFGAMDAAAGMIGTGKSAEDARKTSQNLMAAFVNFARTGNPNNGNMPVWKAYDAKNQTVMIINAQSQPVSNWREAVDKEIADLKIDPFNRASLYQYSE